MSEWKISRRTVLRGLGAAMALPILESMQAPLSFAAPTAAPSSGPLRTAFLFVPNGVHMRDWTPKSEGYNYDLPYVLQPLSRIKDEVCVLTGLTHDKGRANGDGPGDHARSASSFLTGCQPRKTSGANIRIGTSVDQVAARVIGKETRFASLELGCEAGRNAGNCDSGYSCAYSSNISWASDAMPMSKEVNPRLVFERLFAGPRADEAVEGQGQRQFFRKSILDFVSEDARRLRHRLGRNDQQKLDEYLTGVREIERRIERAEQESGTKTQLAGLEVPEGIPQDYAEHIRLMCDMVVLAFQTDLTRVTTLMFADEGSNRSYQQIGIPDGHHDLSHHGGDPKKHAKIRDINRFHMMQFAYLLERLKAIPEGEGSLLDNCMIVYGSGLSDGDRHNHDDLPVLLAGRGAGTIRTGRHIRYESETPMCNLFLSMLERVGAPLERFGDSTGRLPLLG